MVFVCFCLGFFLGGLGFFWLGFFLLGGGDCKGLGFFIGFVCCCFFIMQYDTGRKEMFIVVIRRWTYGKGSLRLRERKPVAATSKDYFICTIPQTG